MLRTRQLRSPHLDGIVIPKVDTVEDLRRVDSYIDQHALPENKERIKIIASVESPLGLMNLKEVSLGRRESSAMPLTLPPSRADCHLFCPLGLTPRRSRPLFPRNARPNGPLAHSSPPKTIAPPLPSSAPTHEWRCCSPARP